MFVVLYLPSFQTYIINRPYLVVCICSSLSFRERCQKQTPWGSCHMHWNFGCVDSAFPCPWSWNWCTVRPGRFLPSQCYGCSCWCSCWQVWVTARLNTYSREAPGKVHACMHTYTPHQRVWAQKLTERIQCCHGTHKNTYSSHTQEHGQPVLSSSLLPSLESAGENTYTHRGPKPPLRKYAPALELKASLT